ncbi:MAG: M3 family oligoendopeptidase [Leptolinea sp.]|jgi:oligoendopeptidase F|nr:M3 family oligoendopeptidase [Leptolinea sp.]
MSDTPKFQQKTWSLKDLLPTGAASELDSLFADLDKMAADFETTRSLLKPDISTEAFLSLVAQQEEMTRKAHILFSYANLSFAADTQDQKALTLLARIQQFTAELTNRTMFFSLWWKDLDDVNADRLMAAAGDNRYWLEEMRHFKKYTLSEPEEIVINLKDVTGSSALNTLYDTITNRYTFNLTINGEVKTMTRGELSVYIREADPNLREQAYKELYRVYGQDAPILGQIYQNLVRDWRNEQITLRKFVSPIAVRNLANDVPDEAVETLLHTTEKNAGLFHRFFQLKARWLGMEKLRRYDVYAPVARSDKTYSFDSAVQMVMDAYQAFDPGIAKLASRVLEEDHFDSEIRRGKQGGAFCLTALPNLTPWVLQSFQGKAEDVATMAHELGHAVHSMLASQHSIFTFHACLPLAETASTFGEMLLVDHLLKQETSEAVRRDVLFRQVDDAFATILRQAYFAIFEKEAHEMVAAGASVDELSAGYMANLKTQFGDAVEISDEFKYEWVSIPHIFNVPFYVYAYSFGQLLVFSLYKQYRQEGEAFKPRYMKILETGGSQSPDSILSAAGIDLRQASFWQGGFDVIDGLVSELEKIPVVR